MRSRSAVKCVQNSVDSLWCLSIHSIFEVLTPVAYKNLNQGGKTDIAMDLHHQLDNNSHSPFPKPDVERSRGKNFSPGSYNFSVKNGSCENPAIKGIQNLRRNSIQRKIFEHELAQAKTTESVKQAFYQVRSVTQKELLAPPTVPTRKLSSSTPNLTLISADSNQMLGPPQNFGGHYRASSPMRIERRSQSPRLSPYPLSPATSAMHLADCCTVGMPVDQLSDMRLSSPQPCRSPNPVNNHMSGRSPQPVLNLDAYNNSNGYSRSPYGADSYEMGSSPSPTVQLNLNGQQMDPDDGLKHAWTSLLEDMMQGGKEPGPIINSSALNFRDDLIRSQQNAFNQPYYGGTSNPVYNSGVTGTSNSQCDFGIQFPLPDNEVSSYCFEYSNQNPSTGWHSNSQQTFMPQPNLMTQMTANSQANPVYTSNPMLHQTQPGHGVNGVNGVNAFSGGNGANGINSVNGASGFNGFSGLTLHEPYGRHRAGSMPSLKMRTTETNPTAFCGSTVVNRVSKKQEQQPTNLGIIYSVPTITVTPDHEGFDGFLSKQKSDADNCDDLISFLNGNNIYTDHCNFDFKPVRLPQDIAGQFDTSQCEDQERWLLADNFARKELGLTTSEPDL